jgi:transposase
VKREEFRVIYDQGPDAVFALVETLVAQVTVLTARVKELEGRINTNSRNSGKPPSSDGLKRTKSLRKKSGKKGGAQKGHPGHTLEMTPKPDKVEVHRVTQCQHCGASLPGRAESFQRRQVVDTPPLKLEVTEHQAEQKTCLICGTCNKASFPEGVTQPVQYGTLIKALAVYMNQYQLIPYDRVEELFKDLFGQPFSEGSLFTANEICCEALEGAEQEIKRQILNAPVINCDETGARVEGKNHWLHVASTPKLTCYSVHQKRGADGMDDMGILPLYTGTCKHDGLNAYFKYTNCRHSLCNDHHLRELKWVIENERQTWAQQMYDLLLDTKAAVDEAKDNSKTCLEMEQLIDFEQCYSSIVALGYHENPFFEVWPRPKGQRGRLKKTKARNLLERLDKYRTETLNFMFDFRIPFGNNQAERDIRMTKVQQKISGGFRSLQGARIFCRIRGYISTVKKNAIPVLGAIRDALMGNPFVPNCTDVLKLGVWPADLGSSCFILKSQTLA